MERQMISTIAHLDHPIAAPVSEVHLERLLTRAKLQGRARILDLGCAEAAWTLRALELYPEAVADGVDINANALVIAAKDAEARGLSDRIRFHEISATDFQPTDFEPTDFQVADARPEGFRVVEEVQEAEVQNADVPGAGVQGAGVQGTDAQSAGIEGADVQGAHVQGADVQSTGLLPVSAVYDLVLCIGSTHAFGGLTETLTRVRSLLRPGGLALVGDGFWEKEPTPELLITLEATPDDYADLAGTVAAMESAGFRVVYGHTSELGEWDEYEWSWTGTLTRWALDNPGPDGEAALAAALEHRDMWLNGYRGFLGFVTLLLRAS